MEFSINNFKPHYAQSNGQAERMIQTIKKLLKKAADSGNDWYTALLQYRNTPISEIDQSPAQLLFNRQLRTKLPVISSSLLSDNVGNARQSLVDRQLNQQHYYDRSVKPLPSLQTGDVVRVRHNNTWQQGIINSKCNSPRSYNVDIETGLTIRRNRRAIIKTAEPPPVCEPFIDNDLPVTSNRIDAQPVTQQVTTRSGRVVRAPVRFKDYVVT